MNKTLHILTFLLIVICQPLIGFCQVKTNNIVLPWDSIRVSQALNGDADAQAYVGWCYFFGEHGVIENDIEAVKWFKKSNTGGSPFGKYYLGLCYLNGLGIAKNTSLGRKYCDSATIEIDRRAESNDLDALFYTGESYQYEADDLQTALKFYLRASDLGDVRSQIAAAVIYYELYGSLSKKEFNMYAKALSNNSPIAQYMFSTYYEDGVGVSRDIEKAFHLAELSANSGYHMGMTQLGKFYENGKGVEQNIEKAIYWYKRAIEYDDYGAEFLLGCLYKNGIAVDRNYNLALKYLRMAAKHNTKDASDKLNELLSMGATKFNQLPLREKGCEDITLSEDDPFLSLVLSDNWDDIPEETKRIILLEFKKDKIHSWGEERATKVAQHIVEIGFTEEQLKYSQGISPNFYKAKTVYYPNGRLRIIEYPHCTYFLVNDNLIAMLWSHGLQVGDSKIIETYQGDYVIIDENP